MDPQQVKNVLSSAEQLCIRRKVRLTSQRKAVLRLLCESERPLSAYELLDLMRQEVDNPAPPTVYRALDFLIEQGLVHKQESLHAYVGCSHPDHPHASQFLICADCGDVAELEDSAVSDSLRAACDAAGFESRRPLIELLGTCADCSRKQNPTI